MMATGGGSSSPLGLDLSDPELGSSCSSEELSALQQQAQNRDAVQEAPLLTARKDNKSTNGASPSLPLIPTIETKVTLNHDNKDQSVLLDPSTRMETPPPCDEHHDETLSFPKNQESLQDRVSELEAKLSTLTILLQATTKRPTLGHSPVVTRSVSPSNHPNTPPEANALPSIPPLESPCSLGPKQRRLSEVLLCDNTSSSSPTPKGEKQTPPMDRRSQLINMESSPQLPKLQDQPILSLEEREPQRGHFLNYLNSFQESTPDVDIQMEEFVRVPSQVEQLLGFGLWICVDCFLYVITILPIRFVWSCLLGFLTLLGIGHHKGPYRFHRRHLYQLMQVSIIFIVYNYVLCNISIGKLYHWIRGQVMLKLYLLIAIVEVFDRLMCSLGQDSWDSLYWNTTRRPHSKRMLVSMSVVLVYAIVHTFLLFVHVATLNVAMNSADQALLSLLIGGNFAEIKSTVFKKYNKQQLFKITASDICERFKLALFLTLVLMLNVIQGMDLRMVYDFCSMCGVVWVAELLSDWVKHSFITKFNHVKSNAYLEYALLLAGDVTGIGHEGVNLDHSHAVVRRIGLAQIPLVCVMFRYLTEAVRYGAPLYQDVSRITVGLWILAVWCVLVIIKYVSGRLLLEVASKKLENAPHVVSLSKRPSSKKKKE